MSKPILKPQLVAIQGILKKLIHLTPELQSVKKETVIMHVSKDGEIVKVITSPNFLPSKLGIPHTDETPGVEAAIAKLRKSEGNAVEFMCEKHIKGVTGYVDKDGSEVFHPEDGYGLQEIYAVGTAMRTRIEAADAGMSESSIDAVLAKLLAMDTSV